MKSLIILFHNKDSSYADKKIFDGKSAVEKVNEWASSCSNKTVTIDVKNTVKEMLFEMKNQAEKAESDYIIFSFDDVPFINKELTDEIVKNHLEYKSEFTYADGFPYGLAPQIIDFGTLKILCELIDKNQSEAEKKVSRDFIFDFIKTDINSFEVESVLSEEDYRLLRISLSCDKKENYIACKELFNQTGNKKLSAEETAKIASKTAGVLKTVPAFYNIQIADACNSKCSFCPYPACFENKNKMLPCNSKNIMDSDKFCSLIDKINEFSENAVVGLSLWGECLNHPDFLRFIEKILSYKGLSVFFETTGEKITDEFCSELKRIADSAEERTNGWQKIIAIVSLDAFTKETYERLHNTSCFESAVNAISKLSGAIPGCVYPQMIRMQQNESELENFYRYWNEKTNASCGELVIQKYDSFAQKLPDYQVADLAPVERNVCYHARRDMSILTNGDVPLCREYVNENIAGNVFNDGIESVWAKLSEVINDQLNNKLCDTCGKCNEFYTFNF